MAQGDRHDLQMSTGIAGNLTMPQTDATIEDNVVIVQ
jgi:hypothetical protein